MVPAPSSSIRRSRSTGIRRQPRRGPGAPRSRKPQRWRAAASVESCRTAGKSNQGERHS
jgi:hypothetical protein